MSNQVTNQEQWLQSYPPFMRDEILEKLVGQKVIRFPFNGHTTKANVTYSASPLWTVLVPYAQDAEMWVTQTAPDSLVDKVISNLTKKSIPFQVSVIEP